MIHNPDFHFGIKLGASLTGTFQDLTGLFVIGYTVPLPAPKTYLVEVPGMDGSLDLTEALGGVKYYNRPVTIQFVALDETTQEEIDAFCAKYNGQRCALNIEEGYQQNGYYLIGRLTITGDDHKEHKRKITCAFDAAPMKILSEETKAASPNAVTALTGYTLNSSSNVKNVAVITNSKELHFQPTGSVGNKCSVVYKLAVNEDAFYITGTTDDCHWWVEDGSNVLLDSENSSGGTTSALLFSEDGFTDVYVHVEYTPATTWDSQKYHKLTDFYASSMYGEAVVAFDNIGVDTIASYSTAGAEGSFRLLLNDVLVTLPATGGKKVYDPRLMVKNGSNLFAASVDTVSQALGVGAVSLHYAQEVL